MRRVGVFTQDFKFYHDVIETLRSWSIPFVSMEHPYEFSKDVVIVLSSAKDRDYGSLQERFSDAKHAVRHSFARLLGKSLFSSLVLGIDPGPRPGLAAVGDGVLTEAMECPSIEALAAEVSDMVCQYTYRDVVIRIGNGDKPNRVAILKLLKELGLLILEVDERGTTIKYRNENNAISAAKIAMAVSLTNNGKKRSGKGRSFVERNFLTIQAVLGS
ncbi:MAG: hypothetical protein M1148_03870 [Candidatus Thermoplasmatota archaeon]|jgi:hypothetical protein|nr:hypothetical protein [Candidatus Thermoplasmatota archaeon]MCL5438316.1 hypothetical protein [Candidatus Thermoplasmatota archaeon]